MNRVIFLVSDLANLGDAFLAEAEAMYVKRQSPALSITIAPDEPPPRDLSQHFRALGFTVLSVRPKEEPFLLACARSHVVLGGGQLIRDSVAPEWLRAATLGCAIARATGHRVIAAGVGVSTLVDPWKRKMWQRLLRTCASVGVRDAASYDTAASLAPFLGSRLRLANDVAFLAEPVGEHGSSSSPRCCVISPANDAPQGLTIDAERIVALVRVMVDRALVDKVRILAHDIRPHVDGDFCAEIARRVTEHCDVNAEVVAGEAGSRILTTYSTAEVIVTARLHGLIAGALLERRVMYFGEVEPKLGPFAARLGYPGLDVEAGADPTKLASAVTRLEAVDLQRVAHEVSASRVEAVTNFAGSPLLGRPQRS